ncbi:dipeptidase [Shinella sp. CPCC 101442]|uniref:dipeptidase n=1 Tax=Shinella sp. CPCC 101442 TaxID=2932265 RepID=UPI002152BD77|nr:dipeptidase [Shinella sp. CPCC 101442]MCR6502082.1 dipeptidase [Shinella sp. CPCC 101442]
MAERNLVPIFDGHNDILYKLHYADEADKVSLFTEGSPNDWHIDLPRAKQGGFAGGMFAVFAPSADIPTEALIENAASVFAIDEPLPAALSMDDAHRTTVAMASILFELDRAGAIALCRSAADIRAARDRNTIAAVFHIEGAEAIDRDLRFLETLYGLGLRSIGPVWSRPNIFGHGVPFRYPSSPDTGPGLTDAGNDLVRACNDKKILIDLSHLNERGFRDVAALSDAPLIATHSNVHRICPHARNLTDWQLGAIRDTRGLVGLNFETTFLRSAPDDLSVPDAEVLLRHMDALILELGEDGVGIGSDFDGATVPELIGDASGLQRLLNVFRDHGYGEDLIEKIAWRNWLSVIERTIG